MPGHESFKGVSTVLGNKPVIVTESRSRGNADFLNRKIYFAVTSYAYKIMATLDDSRLLIEPLYDEQATRANCATLSKIWPNGTRSSGSPGISEPSTLNSSRGVKRAPLYRPSERSPDRCWYSPTNRNRATNT